MTELLFFIFALFCFMFVFLRLNSFLYHSYILNSIYLLMITWLFSSLSAVKSVTMNKEAGLPSLQHMDFFYPLISGTAASLHVCLKFFSRHKAIHGTEGHEPQSTVEIKCRRISAFKILQHDRENALSILLKLCMHFLSPLPSSMKH